jgi:hypothetical protein
MDAGVSRGASIVLAGIFGECFALFGSPGSLTLVAAFC